MQLYNKDHVACVPHISLRVCVERRMRPYPSKQVRIFGCRCCNPPIFQRNDILHFRKDVKLRHYNMHVSSAAVRRCFRRCLRRLQSSLSRMHIRGATARRSYLHRNNGSYNQLRRGHDDKNSLHRPRLLASHLNHSRRLCVLQRRGLPRRGHGITFLLPQRLRGPM